MPIPKEVEDWIAQSPFSDEVKTALRKEAEDDAKAKFARESVMLRSDYSRSMDAKDKEMKQAMADLQAKDSDLTALRDQIAAAGPKFTTEKKNLIERAARLESRFTNAKKRFLEKFDITPAPGETIDDALAAIFEDDGEPDDKAKAAAATASTSTEDFDKRYVTRDGINQLTGAFVKYNNWFLKKDREHFKLTGSYLDPDLIWDQVNKNTDKSYDQIYDALPGVSEAKKAAYDAEIDRLATERADAKFKELMTGRTLEGSKTPDNPVFQSKTVTAEGEEPGPFQSTADEAAYLNKAADAWDAAELSG